MRIAEELGYFDGHEDLDLVLQRIDQKLDRVRKEDRDGATIDQYAYEARRGQIGAKRAERLSRERDYFREQYHLHQLDFQRIEQDRTLLIPRVVRHQLIDIEKRAQEIIATGKGPYEEGRKAVQRARVLLQATHYELVGEGAKIRIKDHVEALQNYTDHPLLGDIIAAHQDGVVADDDAKNLRSAPSLARQLEEELKGLEAERDEVQREIEIYGERHRALMAQAAQLSELPGLHRRAQSQINQLKRADPAGMFQRFKGELEGTGLAEGKRRIAGVIASLDKIEEELDAIRELAQDLRRLNEIIGLLNDREQILSKFLEPLPVTLWGETYKLMFVIRKAKELLKRAQDARAKLEKLQSEYRATQTERELLDETEALNTQLGEEIEGLEQTVDSALQVVDRDVGSDIIRFQNVANKAREKGEWAAQAATVVETAFRAELCTGLARIFKSQTSQIFHTKLSELTATTLGHGLQVIHGAAELADWLATEPVLLEDYTGTDLEQHARKLFDERVELEKLVTGVTRLKRWETIYNRFQSLLGMSSEEDVEAYGQVPQFDEQMDEFRIAVSEATNERINDVESFVEALLATKLLGVSQRGKLIDELADLRRSDCSYSAALATIEQLNKRVGEDAKSQLQELPGGHDPDVVLAIVQEVYRQPYLPLRHALRLDQEGATILWLIRQGVLQGQLRLVKE